MYYSITIVGYYYRYSSVNHLSTLLANTQFTVNVLQTVFYIISFSQCLSSRCCIVNVKSQNSNDCKRNAKKKKITALVTK